MKNIGAGRTVKATELSRYTRQAGNGWRLPVGNAMETLHEVHTPDWGVYLYITPYTGGFPRIVGRVNREAEVTLWDPSTTPEGQLYTVQAQVSVDNGAAWLSVYPTENVVVEWETPAAEVAEQVAANQQVADRGRWRVRVWDGLNADTSTEPAGELETIVAEEASAPPVRSGGRYEYGIRRRRSGEMHREGMTEAQARRWMVEDWGGMTPENVFEVVRRPLGEWEAV